MRSVATTVWLCALACPAMAACAAIAGLEDPSTAVTATDTDAAIVTDASAIDVAVDSPAVVTDSAIDTDTGVDGSVVPDPCRAKDLLAYWRIDEGSGTTVSDCSTYKHDGTLVSGPTWTQGKIGGALSFTTNNYVDFGNPTALHLTGAMTITAFVYARDVMSYGRILSKSGGTGDRGWDFHIEGGDLLFQVAIDTDNRVWARTSGFASGAWKHVAAVFDPGAAIRVYVDGVQAAVETNGIPPLQRDTTRHVRMGLRCDDVYGFDGVIDDVRVFGRALGATEIAELAKP